MDHKTCEQTRYKYVEHIFMNSVLQEISGKWARICIMNSR